MNVALNWAVLLIALAATGAVMFWIATYGHPLAVAKVMIAQRLGRIGRHRRPPKLTRRF